MTAVCVVVDGRYYPAAPAPLYSEVTVRVYADEIEILDADGTVLRRHPKIDAPRPLRAQTRRPDL